MSAVTSLCILSTGRQATVTERGIKMISIEEKEYGNFGNCLVISNGIVEVYVTLDIGPRIIRYGFCGGENMFYEDTERVNGYDKADLKEMFGEGAHWYLYGGHRLWISPEYTESYYPDNYPVEYEEAENGAYFSCGVQDVTGLQFSMAVELTEDTSDVRVSHFVENCSGETQEYALWALTVLDRGGVEIVPFNDKDTALLPNRTLRAWPYTDFSDDRLYMGRRYVTLRSTDKDQSFKLGFDLMHGYAAYINKGCMFVKRFHHYEDGDYPDNGCSFETFTNRHFLECETLSEIGKKPDGSIVTHSEVWSLYDNVELKDPKDEKEISELLKKYDF